MLLLLMPIPIGPLNYSSHFILYCNVFSSFLALTHYFGTAKTNSNQLYTVLVEKGKKNTL